MAELKQKVVKGFAWALLERFSTQGVGFIVSIILARLLTPDDYGAVALLQIFITISGVFATSGFGSALIQKKSPTEQDFHSVFWLSIVLASGIYAILFFAAPWIAAFYHNAALIPLFRVMALGLIFNAVNSIQSVELSRKLLFHLSFQISLIGLLTSAGVGIVLAFLGYGPWALVWSALVGNIVGVITRWYFIAWRPKLMFSWASLRGLFSFGWKLMVSGLLDVGYGNLNGLIIGRWYSAADLAFVHKGRSFPHLAMASINGTLGAVAYPALAQMQDQREVVRNTMRRMIRCSTFFVFPMMTGLACCAGDLVPLMLGEQWLPAVPYMRLACFSFALWPFHTINLQAITALGRSDIFLVLEVIKKVLGVTALVVAVPYGVWWMIALGAFISGPLSVIINAFPNRSLLKYTVEMQLLDVLPTALLCGAMTAVILPLTLLPCAGWIRIILQVLCGGAIFLFLAWVFRVAPLCEYARLGGVRLAARLPRELQPLAQRVLKPLL